MPYLLRRGILVRRVGVETRESSKELIPRFFSKYRAVNTLKYRNMKALKCEMCGSNDVVKQDGLYVCQNCRTKYTVEEAKKMMIEGTVSIDYSSKIGTWSNLATNALDAGNYQEAYDYANKILEQDPENAEAWLIKMKTTAGLSTNGNPRTAEVISSGKNVVLFDPTKQEEVGLFFMEMGIKLLKTASKIAKETSDSIRELYHSYFQTYGKQYAIEACAEADRPQVEMLMNMGDRAYDLEKATKELPIFLKSNQIQSKGKEFRDTYSFEYQYFLIVHIGEYWSPNENAIRNKCETIELAITKDFPALEKRRLEIEEDKKLHPEKYEEKESGCYVATAVYGSYNCPEVWTLRRFRDNILDATWYGRAFIKTYYAISPTLVKWFGETAWFRKMWRKPLDRMVESLKNKGIESTPYRDKY